MKHTSWEDINRKPYDIQRKYNKNDKKEHWFNKFKIQALPKSLPSQRSHVPLSHHLNSDGKEDRTLNQFQRWAKLFLLSSYATTEPFPPGVYSCSFFAAIPSTWRHSFEMVLKGHANQVSQRNEFSLGKILSRQQLPLGNNFPWGTGNLMVHSLSKLRAYYFRGTSPAVLCMFLSMSRGIRKKQLPRQ